MRSLEEERTGITSRTTSRFTIYFYPLTKMISIVSVRDELSQHDDYISAVKLSLILEASVMEVRQRLNELGKCVVCNDRDEWRLVGSLVQKLELSPLSPLEIEERDKLENTLTQAFFTAGQALKLLLLCQDTNES